jgi:hypothetical protein
MLPPIPSAKVITLTSRKAGVFTSVRAAYRKSAIRFSIDLFHFTSVAGGDQPGAAREAVQMRK